MTVNLVTIHHEGAGTPTDTARGAHGGYTYWIGTTRWTRLRSVADSFATLGFNGESVDICLSGNREIHDVSPTDIQMIKAAVTDARQRGEVSNNPLVRAHRNSPGCNTVCPGKETMKDFPAIVNACRIERTGVTPMFNPPLNNIVAGLQTESGSWILRSDGAIYTLAGKYFGGANTLKDFAGRTAALLVAPNATPVGAKRPEHDERAAGYAYVVIATSGERYGLPHGGR